MKYDQLVVIQGSDYGENEKKQKEFLAIFKTHHFHRPKVVGTIETIATKDKDGNVVCGGRKDFFFFINNKDIERFSIWRFNYRMRWWEDVFFNKEEAIYPKSFIKKYPPRW
jgi:hypothetical protein